MTLNKLLTSTASPVTLRVPDFKRVYITLVGCGGTGSHVASGLVAISGRVADGTAFSQGWLCRIGRRPFVSPGWN